MKQMRSKYCNIQNIEIGQKMRESDKNYYFICKLDEKKNKRKRLEKLKQSSER